MLSRRPVGMIGMVGEREKAGAGDGPKECVLTLLCIDDLVR